MCDIVLFIVSLIIGLPCIIMGCNDFSCPLYHINQASVLCSNFVRETCSCCLGANDDGCVEWGQCDCSGFHTGFMHEIGTCELKTKQHYETNEKVAIFVQRFTHDCKLETGLDNNIVYVGLVFLVIASIIVVVWTSCGIIKCCNNKSYN